MNPTALIRLDSSLSPGSSWNCPATSASQILRCDSQSLQTTFTVEGRSLRKWTDPLEALRWMERSAGAGRWVGYFSYDLGRLFERLPSRAKDDLNLPLFVFAWVPARSPSPGTPVEGWGGGCPPVILQPTPTLPSAGAPGERSVGPQHPIHCSSFTRDEYVAAVATLIEYIRDGDVFQVNLSQRLSAELTAPVASIYQRLLDETPAHYGALLDFGDHALICNSPELFLKVTQNSQGQHTVLTRPIKGTRPRLPGMKAQLRESVKDQAELNMIVDLERNDLGRVCEIGSVKVTEPRVIEAHPTVYHGAASVEGTLRPNVSLVDLLRAAFPGGSVTGAPKIRAMEIIDELEPVRRGPYCGAIGYVFGDGTIELNVAIRTMIAKDRQIHIPVGGGVVADSDPASEYDETLVKAAAMLAALKVTT